MKNIFSALIVLLLFAFPFTLGNAAASDDVRRVVHRANVPAGEAVSSKGGFSVRMPAPYDDLTIHVVDENGIGEFVMHVLLGTSPARSTYYVSETPFTPLMKPIELDQMTAAFSMGSEGSVTNVRRQRREGRDMVTFSVNRAHSRGVVCFVKTKGALYQAVVDVPHSDDSPTSESIWAFLNTLQIAE